MRTHVTANDGDTAEPSTTAEVEPSPTQLIAELAIAGLVSVEVADDGGVTYALTPRVSARLS